MSNKEIWKDVPSFEGLYKASNLGKIRSLKFGKTNVLKPGNNKGYLRIGLTKSGKRKHFLVHTLVYTSFNGPIPDGMTIDHINGDKRDNRLENLQLLTPGDNARKSNNKPLVLTNACTSGKYTFSSASEASMFFGYKRKRIVGSYISHAKKRGENFITINKEKHYFHLI